MGSDTLMKTCYAHPPPFFYPSASERGGGWEKWRRRKRENVGESERDKR